jgi:hypothetical protein
MNRQQANAEIARRLGYTERREWHGTWIRKPDGFEKILPDYFTDEAAARELVQWFKFKSWPAFYEALRAILIDNTGQPVGIVDFMLADPADKARAACVALEIELEEEGK